MSTLGRPDGGKLRRPPTLSVLNIYSFITAPLVLSPWAPAGALEGIVLYRGDEKTWFGERSYQVNRSISFFFFFLPLHQHRRHCRCQQNWCLWTDSGSESCICWKTTTPLTICEKHESPVNIITLSKHITVLLSCFTTPSADTTVLCRWTGRFRDRNVFVGVIDGQLERKRVTFALKRESGCVHCPLGSRDSRIYPSCKRPGLPFERAFGMWPETLKNTKTWWVQMLDAQVTELARACTHAWVESLWKVLYSLL